MGSEEFFSIATKTVEFVVALTPILSALGVLGAVFYVRGRAGSASFLRDRLWIVLGGGRDFSEALLQREWQKIRDHERFNYRTGIRFPNRQKIIETLAWLDEFDAGLEELVRVRRYFDSKAVVLRAPRVNFYRAVSNSSMAVFVAMALLLSLSVFPVAFLTIKKTGTLIWASEEQVRSWDGFSWVVTSEDCKMGGLPLGEHDAKVVCDILQDPTRADYLSKSMTSQRIAAFLFFLLAGVFMFFFAREFAVAKSANDLYEKRRRFESKQLEFPF